MHGRENWSSHMAFVMAAAASAVGLGNLWRFPYLAAKYGGGIFLLTYAVLAATLGFTLLVVETAVGRRTRLSPPAAYRSLSPKWQGIGWLGIAAPAIVLCYYNAVGGWTVKYLAVYADRVFRGGEALDAVKSGERFGGFISGGSYAPLVCGAVFAGCTAALVLAGVKKGIERSSKILMPILLALCVAVSCISLSQPGAAEGLEYYLRPDFSAFSWKTVVWAMGQMFFSLSISLGIMITYGSYMRKDDLICRSVLRIEMFDGAVAFLAGLMIIPPTYAFLGPEGVQSQGPGLMFIALPAVFSRMTLFGAGIGDIAGLMFFALAFFAALTSCVSTMETVTSSLRDCTGMRRAPAGTVVAVAMGAALVPISLCYVKDGFFSGDILPGMPLLDFMDFAANNLLMPACGFLTCIFIGWIVGPEWVISETEADGSRFRFRRLFSFTLKYAAPIAIAGIALAYTLKQLDWISM